MKRIMTLTAKHLLFISKYFECGLNATEAARQLGYAFPNTQGPRLLLNVGVREEINRRLTEKHMGADEVLARLADMARSDISTFAKIEDTSALTDEDYKGKTHVIKKFKKNVSRGKDGTVYTNIELELYDAQNALINIGKQHGLFADKHIIETKVEKELDSILEILEETLSPDDFQRIVTRLTSGQTSSPEMATEDTE